MRTTLRLVGEHSGVLIGAAALAGVILGVIGFQIFLPDRGFTEHLYRSLQLFIIYTDATGAPNPSAIPVVLDVARFLAPAAAAAASIRAVLALFGQRATRAWVRYFVRGHVVVCGLGPLGARLALAFKEAGFRVVAIEADGSDAAVHDCRASGVIVLVGDATDRGLLLKSGITTAQYLIAASGVDATDAEVAVAARDVVGRRRRPLPCFVHVVHPGLSGLLAEAALSAGASGLMRLEFFNAWESVPPMVLDDFPPEGAGATAATTPHLVVVGPGRLGRALVVHAARRWASEPDAAGRKLQVTLVGPDASEAGRDLHGRYPRLEHVCDLGTHDLRIDSPEFERAAFVDCEGVTSAYVALEDDALGLRAALSMARVVPHVRVVVLTTQHAGLGTLVSGIRPGSSPIALFDVLGRSCRPEILLNGTIELLARAVHRDYVRVQQAAGRTADTNPSMFDWDDLPESTQEANRSAAADVGTKLAAVGCRIQPWTDWTGEGLTFSADEIERMAEIEHERWCRERAAAGWTYGQTRDDRRKTTPYLVEWSELADDVKDYDRNAVRALPELLTYAGFEIVRLPATPSH